MSDQMEAAVQVLVHDVASSQFGIATTVEDSQSLLFKCPAQLLEANFPTRDTTIPVELATKNPSVAGIYGTHFKKAANLFLSSRQNLVVYAYGPQATPRRQLMYGDGKNAGYATQVFSEVAAGAAGRNHGIFAITCFALGISEHLTDLLNLSNEGGVILESVKEGPRVHNIEKARITSAKDVNNVMRNVVENYTKHFAKVLNLPATPAEQALPPYFPDTIVLSLYRYETEEGFKSGNEANSMSFIALGDSERPVLCGISPDQITQYERTHRILASAAGIVSAIRCYRLRVPFGKSKLSQLLKRAYNGERGNPNNEKNRPTCSVFLCHLFSDGLHAEESFHTLCLARRLCSQVGTSGIGSITRDLAADKWRLEQDILELKDELTIAKQVYDYRPCIFEQAKPVMNIQEEEAKRVSVIQKRRDEARERVHAEIRAKAQEEAKAIIAEEERKYGTTLVELEKRLEEKRKEIAVVQSERTERVKEFEHTLEKIRRKRDEEETAVTKLSEELLVLEGEVATRQEAIQQKERQLELATLDDGKGNEVFQKERAKIKEQRAKLFRERQAQREQWIQQIRTVNEEVLRQVKQLTAIRKGQAGRVATVEEEETEASVREDIESIDKYLPKLISLDDMPADVDATESIRRQLEEYFTAERKSYIAKIEAEKVKKERLEKAIDMYKAKLVESQTLRRRDQVQLAIKKEQNLKMLIDQVVRYLQHGVRLYKVSSKGNVSCRFYFLSDDFKKIHATELDDLKMPVNRRQPSLTIFLKDIKTVVMGMYTSSFTNFSGETQLARQRNAFLTDAGTSWPNPTPPITPENLGQFNYRAFALLLRGGRTLEVVCENDSDYEAWMVSLRRLLGYQTPFTRELEAKVCARDGVSVPPYTCTADMRWGGTLNINGMNGFVSLQQGEDQLCSANHIPPALFLRCKQELTERSQTSVVTVYDIRAEYGLDLMRSGRLYEFLVENRCIPPPL